MTGKERVERMFNRQPQDRIPCYESFWPETITRWQSEGLSGNTEDVLDLLGSDMHGLGWLWPQAFPGRERTVAQTETTRDVRDANGKLVRYWKGRSGTPEHLGFDCDSREKWEKVYKPALLSSGIQIDPHAALRRFKEARELNRWAFYPTVEGFEETRSLMGDEITLIAMAEDPEWVQDVSRTFTDVVLRNLDAIIANGAHFDGLWLYGDMAFKTATMCSPSMYRELIWPDHKRFAMWAHAHGMKIIYHTDGDVNGVIDLYLEAGFDCLQPLESKASMDIRKLCPKYGDRLATFGNIDVMKYATNDLALIEEEIISKFNAGKATRGYAYHSDHSVPPSVSWPTYQAIIEMVKKHGQY